ncbi:hypothetical protein AAY473_007199 [Plecturocebus cupreus]
MPEPAPFVSSLSAVPKPEASGRCNWEKGAQPVSSLRPSETMSWILDLNALAERGLKPYVWLGGVAQLMSVIPALWEAKVGRS